MTQARDITLLFALLISFAASKSCLRGSMSAAKSSEEVRSSLMNLYTSDQSQISLIRSIHGFFVPTSLPTDGLMNETSTTDQMLLALYTNETILTNYNCSEHQSCHMNSSFLTSREFPYFSVEGYYALADASLSSSYWELSSNAILNNTLIKDDNPSLSGFIGLGLGGDAKSNFKVQPSFSIFLASNGNHGQLLFTPDMSLADSGTPVATLSVDSNWHVHGVNSIGVGSLIGVENTSLIFDINSGTIGLPLVIFAQLIENLESEYGFTCSSDTYQPVCSNYELGETLPPLTIIIGGQILSLPYNIYSQGGNGDIQSYEIILNIRALASNLTGHCYVTPTYENYIILNYHVLSYYYTIFDGNNQQIALYAADHSESMNYILYIIIGWFGFFVVLALCYYCYVRIRMARAANVRPVEEETGSIQASLIRNSEAVDGINSQIPNQEQNSSQGEIVN